MYNRYIINFFVKCFLSIFMTICLMFGSRYPVLGQKTAPKVIGQRLEAMLRSDNPDTIEAFLSDRFSVGPYTLPSALSCLKSIAKGLDYEKVQIRAHSSPVQQAVLDVRFGKKGEKDKSGRIVLDDNGKILYVDVFDELYGMDRNAHSALVAEVPFETDDHGSVILEVKLNNSDRVLRLLFDTGADGMALSESLADSLGIKADVTQSTSVVGGHMDIGISRNNTVHLGKLVLPHQSIALFKEVDKYDGILGNTIVRSFITEVNYDKQTVSFYNFGDFDLKAYGGKQGHVVDVTLPSGVIIIPGKLSVTKGKQYKGDFVFDLGAAYGLICFRPFVKHNRLLVDGFKPAYSGSTTSLGMTTPTFTGPANAFRFGDLPAIEGLCVTLMSGGGQSESWNPGFDGSIGTRLISKYNFIINMQDKKILLQPNKSFHYPADFTRSNMLFGFSTNGELYFQNYVGIQAPSDAIATGTKILSIDGVSSDELREDHDRLKALLEKGVDNKFTLKYLEHGKVRIKEI